MRVATLVPCPTTSQFVEVTEESEIAISEDVVIVVSVFFAAVFIVVSCVAAVIAVVVVSAFTVVTLFAVIGVAIVALFAAGGNAVHRLELVRLYILLIFLKLWP